VLCRQGSREAGRRTMWWFKDSDESVRESVCGGEAEGHRRWAYRNRNRLDRVASTGPGEQLRREASASAGAGKTAVRMAWMSTRCMLVSRPLPWGESAEGSKRAALLAHAHDGGRGV